MFFYTHRIYMDQRHSQEKYHRSYNKDTPDNEHHLLGSYCNGASSKFGDFYACFEKIFLTSYFILKKKIFLHSGFKSIDPTHQKKFLSPILFIKE